ncbi:MAG: polysaccharide pyruvyl transferase family protein [Chitinophagaceae bacterium]
MNILITGWFSFEGMGNTAGDMIARDNVCGWLEKANITYEVAVADAFPYPGGVNWQTVDPAKYTDLLFVCGPFGNGWPVTDLLARFADCRLIGLNLTLIQPLEEWNPFTILYERDSSATSNPDISIYAPPPQVPVVGVILITKQDEYGKRDQHEKAHEAIKHLTDNREMSIVHIDTALENNTGGLRTPGEIESLIARMDIVITTRLHGTVLALKNGVPVIPIDSVTGGAKLSRQVKTLEWPILINVEELNDKILKEAFEFCLSKEAKIKAKECASKAKNKINRIRKHLIIDLLNLKKTELQL